MIVSKLDAASIQLDRAIQCFFNGDHVSTITLGEAAKEILDTLLAADGKQSSTQFLLTHFQDTADPQMTESRLKKEHLNVVRNWLKHADKDSDTQCEVGERDSVFTLMQTIPCYQKLTNQSTAQIKRFGLYHQDNKDRLDELFS